MIAGLIVNPVVTVLSQPDHEANTSTYVPEVVYTEDPTVKVFPAQREYNCDPVIDGLTVRLVVIVLSQPFVAITISV